MTRELYASARHCSLIYGRSLTPWKFNICRLLTHNLTLRPGPPIATKVKHLSLLNHAYHVKWGGLQYGELLCLLGHFSYYDEFPMEISSTNKLSLIMWPWETDFFHTEFSLILQQSSAHKTVSQVGLLDELKRIVRRTRSSATKRIK